MTPEEKKTNDLVGILFDAGFDSGWSISNDELVLWEHEEEPPFPLTRPVK